MSEEARSELSRDDHWQRLDPRMLLVHPVRELVRFLPFVIIAFIAGSASGGADGWHWAGVGVPVALGLLRYLTTGFRIAGGRVELRRGLLNRHVLSTPVDRVRTVDLTASPVHRVLGLATVRIGTGQGAGREQERLDLDALPRARAEELRRELLARTAPTGGAADAPDDVVVRFDPAWVLYAPLTSAGVVLLAAVLGTVTQVVNGLGWWGRLDRLDAAGISWVLTAVVGLLGAIVLVSVLAVVASALANWGLTLTRARAGSPSWDLRRGLLTTRETSIDADRIRGVTVGEPLGLRLAGAARLTAVVGGLDRKQRGSAVLVPPAPAARVRGVAAQVLAHPPASAPVAGDLRDHGPRAVRRRWTRALLPAAALSVAWIALVPAAGWPTGLLVSALLPPLVGCGLAADRARGLGHRLDPGVLTVRSGSLTRRRTSLRTAGIIGWTFRSTPFQRRAGLVTLMATTAGGRQAYAALDLPIADAVPLADAAVPGLLTPFLA